MEAPAAPDNGMVGRPLRAAVTGADLSCTHNGERWAPDTVRALRAGDRIAFGPARRGVRGYLAMAGGIAVPSVMGSRATDLLARMGGLEGRILRAGDTLPIGDAEAHALSPGGLYADLEPPATLIEREIVRVLPGHRATGAARRGLQRLVDTWYRVDARSDRVGLRLVGPKVEAAVRGDEISEGMAIGALEITSTGDPLLLMRSRGSIGGYPTLAVIISADLPALAQRKPGDRLRFTIVDEAKALEAWRAQRTVTLLSPAWAVVTREAAPGDPPAATLGERIEMGAPIAWLEVMGTRRMLHSPIAGRLLRMFVEDGEDASEGAPICEVLADE
ncbi:MAG: urea amidolyase [bacterium]|nr:urea amidolyase [bacterium]